MSYSARIGANSSFGMGSKIKLPGNMRLPSLTVVSVAEPRVSSAKAGRGRAPAKGTAAAPCIKVRRDRVMEGLPINSFMRI